MKTKTRLGLMFGLLLLAFGATVFGLQRWYAREAGRLMAGLQGERQLLLHEVLQLASQPVRGFARDYSNWDEMVAFVRSGDPAWAAINLDSSLQTFGVHGAWVLKPNGALVHGSVRQLDAARRQPPFPLEPVLTRMRRENFAVFFVAVPEGLLEIRTAPIQPSADLRRDTEPQGWFLVGQLWNESYLGTLSRVLDSNLKLIAPDAVLKSAATDFGLHLKHELIGWDGQPVRQLQVDYHPASLLVPLQKDRIEMIAFCSFGVMVMACTAAGIAQWVIKPLRQLEESMATNSPAPLAGLLNKPDEFGRLAQLTAASFAHRAALEREAEDRARADAAVRHSEEQVRLSAELRARLARDLHDNIIQSIYATGLGLESVRRSLRDDPTTAEEHLDAVGKTLNQLIREIRSFISGLEPERPVAPAQFAQVLQTLTTTLQSLHPVRIDLDLNPVAAARLTAQEEVHTLQIVREGVSNALRHGGATQLELRLLDQAGVSVLRIEDNGRGFDPAAVTGSGSGLNNQAARAREMGATLRFDSAPGKGTCVTLRFDRFPPA